MYYVRLASILWIVVGLFTASCATQPTQPFPLQARIYDLDTGAVIQGTIPDARQTHGFLSGSNTRTGEALQGEYSTLIDDRVTRSYSNAQAHTVGRAGLGTMPFTYSSYTWATGYGLTFDDPTLLYGGATLIGNKGTTIDIVYGINRYTLHGYGVGRDAKGKRYKVYF